MTYRLYTFVNHLYMNEKQWGIQTAHCVSTMSRAYKTSSKEYKAYADWADNEPTIIMCEGGNVAMLEALHVKLSLLAEKFRLPMVKFHEDAQSLGGVITSVAILVPDTVFNWVVTRNQVTQATEFINPENGKVCFDGDLFDLLSIVKLARLA